MIFITRVSIIFLLGICSHLVANQNLDVTSDQKIASDGTNPIVKGSYAIKVSFECISQSDIFRIENELNSNLKSKGYVACSSSTKPDFVISLTVKSSIQEIRKREFGTNTYGLTGSIASIANGAGITTNALSRPIDYAVKQAADDIEVDAKLDISCHSLVSSKAEITQSSIYTWSGSNCPLHLALNKFKAIMDMALP